MEPHSPNSIEVFYSYSHKDEELRKELETHLKILERQGVITSWHDRKIVAGEEWDRQIDKHLETANVILLLVSPDFIASDYCYDIEMKRAMERHEAGEACVIPVILRPCYWGNAPFNKLQFLPGRSPVINWPIQDEAFTNVVVGIKEAIDKFSSKVVSTSLPSFIPGLPVANFVARQDAQGRDIAGRLKEVLALQKRPLVALYGPGGVGKTTLAAEVARAMRENFHRRIVWISAWSRSDLSLSTLVDEIAAQLGRTDLRALAPELKEERVRKLVTSAPTLIVLDDFEIMMPEEQIRCIDFLKGLDPYPALIITRSPVDDAYSIHLDVMSFAEAHGFLQQLIEQMRRPSVFAELDREHIIRTTGANPLVLQWVVKQIDLAKEPSTVLSYLAQGIGDAAKRVFDRSFNLPQVGDDGRAALLALSLFIPSASRKSLAEVAGFGNDLLRLDRAIESLARLCLIEPTEGHKRLMIEGLTHELAAAHLSKSMGAHEFRRRFIIYFLRYAATYSKLPLPDFAALELEKDNVLNAINVLIGMSDKESVMQEVIEAIDFNDISAVLRVRGYWDSAIPREEQVTEVMHKMPTEDQVARFAYNIALIYQSRRKLAEARQLYDESLEICRSLSDQSGIANTLYQLATIALDQGDLIEAKRFYDESLEIMKKLGDHSSIASILHNLGMIEVEKGNRAKAAGLFIEALSIFEKLDSPYMEIARRNLEKIESDESFEPDS